MCEKDYDFPDEDDYDVYSRDPGCLPGETHKWRNPDPEWAGRQMSPFSPTVTYVRYCTKCGLEKTLRSPIQDYGGYIKEDEVTFRKLPGYMRTD